MSRSSEREAAQPSDLHDILDEIGQVRVLLGLDGFLQVFGPSSMASEPLCQLSRSFSSLEDIIWQVQDVGRTEAQANRIMSFQTISERTWELAHAVSHIHHCVKKLQVSQHQSFGRLMYMPPFKATASDDAVLAEITECLNKAILHFVNNENVKILDLAACMRDLVIREQEWIQAAEFTEFIENVIQLSKGFHFLSEYKEEDMSYLGEDLEANLQQWPRPGEKQVWLLGGKSSIMMSAFAYQLCLRLEAASGPQSPILGASLFFTESYPTTTSDLLCLSSLAYQLQAKICLDTNIVINMIRNHNTEQYSTIRRISATKEMIRSALVATSSKPIIICVNEIDWHNVELLQYLQSLVSVYPQLHIFAASRSKPLLEQKAFRELGDYYELPDTKRKKLWKYL